MATKVLLSRFLADGANGEARKPTELKCEAPPSGVAATAWVPPPEAVSMTDRAGNTFYRDGGYDFDGSGEVIKMDLNQSDGEDAEPTGPLASNDTTAGITREHSPPRRMRATGPYTECASSRKGGDTYGTRRTKADSWGRSNKASRERMRLYNLKKQGQKERREMDAFERRAYSESHPQVCPVCLDREKTHLVGNCGDTANGHRGHGYCEPCADYLVAHHGVCAVCRGAVQACWPVGTGFFA